MTFPSPSEDSVEQSRRVIRQYENDKEGRRRRRLDLAKDEGLLMVAPGQW